MIYDLVIFKKKNITIERNKQLMKLKNYERLENYNL